MRTDRVNTIRNRPVAARQIPHRRKPGVDARLHDLWIREGHIAHSFQQIGKAIGVTPEAVRIWTSTALHTVKWKLLACYDGNQQELEADVFAILHATNQRPGSHIISIRPRGPAPQQEEEHEHRSWLQHETTTVLPSALKRFQDFCLQHGIA